MQLHVGRDAELHRRERTDRPHRPVASSIPRAMRLIASASDDPCSARPDLDPAAVVLAAARAPAVARSSSFLKVCQSCRRSQHIRWWVGMDAVTFPPLLRKVRRLPGTVQDALSQVQSPRGVKAVMLGTGQTTLIQGGKYGVALDALVPVPDVGPHPAR